MKILKPQFLLALAVTLMAGLLIGCSSQPNSDVQNSVNELNKDVPKDVGGVPPEMVGPPVTSRGGADSGDNRSPGAAKGGGQ